MTDKINTNPTVDVPDVAARDISADCPGYSREKMALCLHLNPSLADADEWGWDDDSVFAMALERLEGRANLIKNVRAREKVLIAERDALIEALIWCSGSNDFNDGGIAREGWVKICAPLLPSMPDNPVSAPLATKQPASDVTALPKYLVVRKARQSHNQVIIHNTINDHETDCVTFNAELIPAVIAALAALKGEIDTDHGPTRAALKGHKMNDLWKNFEADFNSMTDAQVEEEAARAQDSLDEASDWLEAVASWKAAGKPRDADQIAALKGGAE